MKTQVLSNSRVAANSMPIFRPSEISADAGPSGVYIGKTATYKNPFFLDQEGLLNPHVIAIGTTGSGKTYFLKNFLVRSRFAKGSSILVVDWNGEYSEVVRFLDGNVINLGRDSGMNVFEFFNSSKTGVSGCIVDSLAGSLGLDSDEIALLHKKIGTASGSGHGKGKPPSLAKVISGIGPRDGEGGKSLKLKLKRLSGSAIFADSTSFPVPAIGEGVTSINLGFLESDSDRELAAKAVIDIVIEQMHGMKIGGGGSRIILLDETWKLLGGDSNLGQLFREGRKYGFSVVAASQLAKDLDSDMISNAACIAVFKLQGGDDYSTLLSHCAIAEAHRQQVFALDRGSCLMHLAYKSGNADRQSFFIKAVDGLPTSIYALRGANMELRISGEKFSRVTSAHIRDAEVRGRLINTMEANDRCLEITAMIRLMAKASMDRAEIVAYLRALGMGDAEIAGAYGATTEVILDQGV